MQELRIPGLRTIEFSETILHSLNVTGRCHPETRLVYMALPISAKIHGRLPIQSSCTCRFPHSTSASSIWCRLRIGGGTKMMKVGALALLGVAIFISSLVSLPPKAFGQAESARKACCLQMGGDWHTRGSTNTYYCYQLGRGRADAFYQCVQKKTGGGK
jgi:hypothetical protein